ncbi:MAG: hypothetical protein AAF318_03290 [Pseudomonadota bacterium]
MRLLGMILFVTCLAGCVQATLPFKRATQPIQFRSPHLAEDVAPYAEIGERMIAGQAFIRVTGGGVATCAGNDAWLLPKTPLSEEALDIWRRGDGVYTNNVQSTGYKVTKRSRCDAGGNFIFEGVPALPHYVFVRVRWMGQSVGWDEGELTTHWLVREVDVSFQSEPRVILSRNERLGRFVVGVSSGAASFQNEIDAVGEFENKIDTVKFNAQLRAVAKLF